MKCSEKVQRWAISQMRGLPTYVDGRVAILGDAVSSSVSQSEFNLYETIVQAHAMTTHLGAGAGQAIEVILAYRDDIARC